VCFATRFRGLDALFEDVFGFFDEEAVQVDGVAVDAAVGVVGAENVVARLAVVLFHLRGVLFAFLRELVRPRAIAGLVGLVRFVEAGTSFAGFLAREVAEAVIFGLCVGGRVVQGWG
jgi:hypothetical protein